MKKKLVNLIMRSVSSNPKPNPSLRFLWKRRQKTRLNKTGTSQVGAISKAQKAQNIFLEKKLKFLKKKFLPENVAQCRKM